MANKDLKFWGDYQAAKQSGQGDLFLKNHPKFAQNANLQQGRPAGDRRGIGPEGSPNPARGYNMRQMKGILGADVESRQYAMDQNMQGNRFNQYNPYGSQTWNQNPDGSWNQNTQMSANQQQLLAGQEQRDIGIDQASQGRMGQIQNQGNWNFQGQNNNWQGYGNAPQLYGANDLEGTRDKVSQNMMSRFESLNEPAFQKQDEDFRQRMANQGIQEGSDDWQKRYQMEVQDPQSRAREQAGFEAINQGGAEQSRLFGMSSQARGQMTGESDQDYANRMGLRQQQFGEAQFARGLPYQEMQAMQGMRGGVTNQQYATPYMGEMQPTDVAGVGTAFKGYKTQRQVADTQATAARDVAGINKSAAIESATIAANAKEGSGDDPDFDGEMGYTRSATSAQGIMNQAPTPVPRSAQMQPRARMMRGGALRRNPRMRVR